MSKSPLISLIYLCIYETHSGLNRYVDGVDVQFLILLLLPLDVTKSDELDLESFSAVPKAYGTKLFPKFFLLSFGQHPCGASKTIESANMKGPNKSGDVS